MSQSEAPSPPFLSIEGLAVRRGGRMLFEDLRLTASAATVTLIRGPNGAGKSSLLLAIAGVLPPAVGTIAYRGHGADAELASSLHFVGHQTGVKTRLTLAENLDFWAEMFDAKGGLSPEAALQAVGLGGRGGIDAGYLSAGQTRRLALARLLVAPRPVWLLDEPTAALDAEGDGMVEGLLGAHARSGGIAIVATHHDLAVAAPAKIATITLGAVA
jgi:heme exporter protein A